MLQHLYEQIQKHEDTILSQYFITFIFDGKILTKLITKMDNIHNTYEPYKVYEAAAINVNDTRVGLIENTKEAEALEQFLDLNIPFSPWGLTIRYNKFFEISMKYRKKIPFEELKEYLIPFKTVKRLHKYIVDVEENATKNAKDLLNMWLKKEEVDSILYLGYVDIKSSIYPNTYYRLYLEGLTTKIITWPIIKQEETKATFYCIQGQKYRLNKYDNLLAKIAVLKTDEQEFLKQGVLLNSTYH